MPLITEFAKPKASTMPEQWTDYSKRSNSDASSFTGESSSENLAPMYRGIFVDWGAKFERSTGSYLLTKDKLPADVLNAIHASKANFDRVLQKIDKKLQKISPEAVASKLNIAKHFDTTLWKFEKEFKKNVKNITIPVQMTDEQRAKIAEEWQNNMKLWIHSFTEQQIVKLRKDMQETIFSGNRRESAIQTIRDSYGVSENKAKFLARQETGLLMAKFKEVRYKDAGITKYKWGCVAGTAKHPVRPWHKALEGKIYSWDDPPITSQPGRAIARNNPGQDYNCRCFALPVVSFKK